MAVCLAALNFDRAEALFFKIKPMSAQKDAECFKVVKQAGGGAIVGSYEASGATEGVKARLMFGETKVWESKLASTKIQHSANQIGTYALCFESTVDQIQTISFNIKVAAIGQQDAGDNKDFVTKEHTTSFQELVNRLEQRAGDIVDQQQYAITRESVHRDTAESTNARVMWWTVLEVSSLVLLAAFQVYYLRSFFEVKQIV